MFPRLLVVILPTAFALGACGLARTEQFRTEVAACKARSSSSATERALCLNKAEAVLSSGRHADLVQQRHAARLSLAAQVDARKITQAQADQEYEQIVARISSEYKDREHAASMARGAAMSAAMAPVRFR